MYEFMVNTLNDFRNEMKTFKDKIEQQLPERQQQGSSELRLPPGLQQPVRPEFQQFPQFQERDQGELQPNTAQW
jgi:hypothetical protein